MRQLSDRLWPPLVIFFVIAVCYLAAHTLGRYEVFSYYGAESDDFPVFMGKARFVKVDRWRGRVWHWFQGSGWTEFSEKWGMSIHWEELPQKKTP